MYKKIIRLFLIITIIIISLCFFSCKKKLSDEEKLLQEGYYKIVFDGGVATSSVEYNFSFIVKPGSKIIEPGKNDTPYFINSDYYKLEGWYKNPDFYGEKWNFKIDTVNESMTLYANWQRNYTYEIMAYDDEKNDFELWGMAVSELNGKFDSSKIIYNEKLQYTFLGEYYSDIEMRELWNENYEHIGFEENNGSYDIKIYAKTLKGKYILAKTAEDISNLSVSSNVYLIGNENKIIDFSDVDFKMLNVYSGKFIGNGVTIKNINAIGKQSFLNIGLFGSIENAVIKDVYFENCSFTTEINEPQKNASIRNHGFLSGEVDNRSTIKNVSFHNCAYTINLGFTYNIKNERAYFANIQDESDSHKWTGIYTESENISGINGEIHFNRIETEYN